MISERQAGITVLDGSRIDDYLTAPITNPGADGWQLVALMAGDDLMVGDGAFLIISRKGSDDTILHVQHGVDHVAGPALQPVKLEVIASLVLPRCAIFLAHWNGTIDAVELAVRLIASGMPRLLPVFLPGEEVLVAIQTEAEKIDVQIAKIAGGRDTYKPIAKAPFETKFTPAKMEADQFATGKFGRPFP